MRLRFRPGMLRWAILLPLCLGGCAGLYFREAEAPPAPVRHNLAAWPSRDYWTGLVFNGEKIGLTHLTLALASVNKREALVEYSRIRADVPVPNPRGVSALRVLLIGLPESFVVPSDEWQRCERREAGTACVIRVADAARLSQPGAAPPEQTLARHLAATLAIQSDEPATAALAREIAGGATEPVARIKRLVEWLGAHIDQESLDVFSSVDVLKERKAECQGLTLLYAAFARSLGIPTRVTNGLVYSTEPEGFLYHTWAESFLGGGWLPVDPTFGQVGADATHIKLLDGEKPSDLLPLVEIVGRLKLRIEAVEPAS